MERGTLRDRQKSRFGLFGEARIDNYWHKSQGAAGLDGIRKRLRHPLFRLQRYVLVEGTGASERQHFRRVGDRGKRRGEWAGIDHGDCAGLRSAMPLLRRGEHSLARLGPRDLWGVFNSARLRALDETRPGENAPC